MKRCSVVSSSKPHIGHTPDIRQNTPRNESVRCRNTVQLQSPNKNVTIREPTYTNQAQSKTDRDYRRPEDFCPFHFHSLRNTPQRHPSISICPF
ncbi:hypothetical protein Hanom_Chr16g01510661 [Helianthus anomalus]